MSELIKEKTILNSESLVARVAISTFTFMREAGLKVAIVATPTEILSYTLIITDLTTDGEPFGTTIKIDTATISVHNIEDNEVAIENFAYLCTKRVADGMFEEKCRRIRQFKEEVAPTSSLIMP